MQTVFIRFLTQEDRMRGFYELATQARISSLPGEVYQVPIEAICLLEERHIAYRRATDAEVKVAHDQVQILLPLFHNDGRPVEQKAFIQTDDDLVQLFGATSTDTVVVHGRWQYQTTLYQDQLIRVRFDVEDKPENWQAVRAFKETLKTRFEQLDVWITAHRIDVV